MIYKNNNKVSDIMLQYYIFWKSYIKNNYSIITKLFTGVFLSSIICKTCDNISVNLNHSYNTQLQIPYDNCELFKCIELFSNDEELDYDNMYNCEKCKTTTKANKNIFLWELPEICIFHLKRFKHLPNKTLVKNNFNVLFPLYNLCLYGIYASNT